MKLLVMWHVAGNKDVPYNQEFDKLDEILVVGVVVEYVMKAKML
jgi:hypothetical protein